MNSYFTLTKTFIHALGMSAADTKKRKVYRAFLTFFVLFFILVPGFLVVASITSMTASVMTQVGVPEMTMEIMVHIICVFSVIFGLPAVFSELYFTGDIEHIMPWPLHARQIVGAKFTAIYIGENLMQFAFLLACLFGYGLELGLSKLSWALGLIGIVILPILPVAYTAIASMLVMSFTRIVKNKDSVQRLTLVFLMAMLFVGIAVVGNYYKMDFDLFVENIATGGETIFHAADIIFPSVPLYIASVTEGSIPLFLAFLGVNVLSVLVLLGLSELLYFRGVHNVSDNGGATGEQDFDKLLGKAKQEHPFISYFKKELHIVVRTPAFFSNCVVPNFIWPVVIFAAYKLSGTHMTIAKLSDLYIAGDRQVHMYILMGVAGMSALVTAVNSLSSGAMSREGKHFSFMKYIPVPYLTQWHAKAAVGMLFPFAGMLIFLVPLCIALHIPFVNAIAYITISFLSVSFTAYMGLHVDSINPKLVWDDELNALRENYNTLFAMGLALGFAAIICGIVYLTFAKLQLSFVVATLILAAALLVANVIMQLITYRTAQKNIEAVE